MACPLSYMPLFFCSNLLSRPSRFFTITKFRRTNMFSEAIAFFTGLTVTAERGNITSIAGIKTEPLMTSLTNRWNTSKIGGNMFRKVRRMYLEMDDFFLPDFCYIANALQTDRRARISSKMLRECLDGIYKSTWMKQTVADNVPHRLNFANLSRLKWSPLEHQDRFFKIYDNNTSRYNLKGYILGAAPGSGKTFMGIALSEMLDTDITICVVPKNAVDRVWVDTLASIFKTPTSYWASTSGQPIKDGYRYYVAHYEQIGTLLAHFSSHAKGKKINIILDESHNMNEIKSQRCENFIELCKVTESQDILWASGTPIKAMGSEVIPILRTIDPLFTPQVEGRFKNIFGLSSARGLDILAHRLGYMTFKVDKKIVVGNTIRKYRVDVKMKGGDFYTLDSVRSEMSRFIKERTDYYKANLKEYYKQYFDGLREYEYTLTPGDKEEYRKYRQTAELLHTSYDAKIHKTEPVFCNNYEKRKIMPVLGKASREQFKNARSVYKYLELKIQGEALGRILGKMRSNCNVEMINAWENYTVTDIATGDKYESNLIDIVDQSEKKSVLFTSYVEVVDKVAEVFKNAGASPLKVYGDTNKDLPAIVKVFERDPKANPLAATLQSLSTAVPLIMANTVVFLNAPFRAHEYEQAQSRVDRLGQTEIVHIYDVYLDTGNEPNISTRSSDIMDWSKAQVEAIMGKGVGDYSAGLEDLREDLEGNDWFAAFEEMNAEHQREKVQGKVPALECFTW